MKIAMVASEARPFCKTGGLADVVYSLSKELTVIGEEVMVILPFYQNVKNTIKTPVKLVDSFVVNMSWRHHEAKVYLTYADGITYYFIEHWYFERNHLYGDGDDGERFAFFALAAREFLARQKNVPDIIHVHDWQAGMLPCLCKEDDWYRPGFSKTKFVMTIHNPAFQGMLDRDALGDLYNLPLSLFDDGKVRLMDRVSTLKAGIVYADKITTVSPTHRQELLTPEGGMHLDGVLNLREWDFCGILNGIDYLEFDPEHDQFIAEPYTKTNFWSKKKANKAALFKELNINDYDRPCYSIVSRLTWQKGLDILFPAIEELAYRGCNIIVLGSGERQYELELERLRAAYPDKIAIYIGYNDALAHRIYAASDFFMMPSLFEPCGLGQMIAQRYGTLPIVRRTGGLKDSVINFDSSNQDTANGFGFDNYHPDDMRYTCIYAYDTWFNKPLIKKLMKNAITTDNSWAKSAANYLGVYKELVNRK